MQICQPRSQTGFMAPISRVLTEMPAQWTVHLDGMTAPCFMIPERVNG
jgi:hypothetical protein